MSKAKSSIIFLSFFVFTTVSFAEQPVFVREFLGQIDFAKSRLMQLAEAMPEDKYSWTPGEGVRSVGEVYVHAAEANYYMLSLLKGEKVEMSSPESKADKKIALEMMEKSFSARGYVDAIVTPEETRDTLAFLLEVSAEYTGPHVGPYVLPEHL